MTSISTTSIAIDRYQGAISKRSLTKSISSNCNAYKDFFADFVYNAYKDFFVTHVSFCLSSPGLEQKESSFHILFNISIFLMYISNI